MRCRLVVNRLVKYDTTPRQAADGTNKREMRVEMGAGRHAHPHKGENRCSQPLLAQASTSAHCTQRMRFTIRWIMRIPEMSKAIRRKGTPRASPRAQLQGEGPLGGATPRCRVPLSPNATSAPNFPKNFPKPQNFRVKNSPLHTPCKPVPLYTTNPSPRPPEMPLITLLDDHENTDNDFHAGASRWRGF